MFAPLTKPDLGATWEDARVYLRPACFVDRPHELDDACLRRIGYRIPVGPLSEQSYRALLRRQARQRRIDLDDSAIAFLIEHLHRRTGRALLAAYPHELLGRIADFAGLSGQAPCCDVDGLTRAWYSLFGEGDAP